MKASYKLIFVIFSFIFYVFIFLMEFFLLKNIIEYFFVNLITRLIVYGILLIIVNPIFTYIFIRRLPLKPNKRIKGNIDEELKRH